MAHASLQLLHALLLTKPGLLHLQVDDGEGLEK